MDKDWVQELVRIMARLRAEDGCPWDREQTHETLKPYLIEEAYELIDAIDDNDDLHIEDELGDVLLQVVFHAQIASEEERFDLQDIARRISEKLVRRHPHVFADSQVENASGVVRQWEEIKKQEKTSSRRKSILDGVPRHLPGLSRAQKLQKKAAKYGFDWDQPKDVIAKIEEELAELKEALDTQQHGHVKEEFGDFLFTIVNLCRFMDVDAEEALSGTSRKFCRRFKVIEREVEVSGRDFGDLTLEELDAFWDQAKAAEKD